jgi:hypothetical protein
MERRVIERRERSVNHSNRPPQILQERVGLSRGLAEGPAVEPTDETHKMPVGEGDLVAGGCRDGHGNEARPPQMSHRRVFGLEHAAVFAWIRDLQDKAFAVSRLDLEVLVALAWQRGRTRVETEEIGRETFGVFRVQSRGVDGRGHDESVARNFSSA